MGQQHLHALVAACLLTCAGCARRTAHTSAAGDASGPRELSVRVPAGLRIARAIDSLSVSIDPGSLGETEVTADPGTIIGIETECFAFALGQARPALGRRGFTSGSDFDVGIVTWSTKQDGLPQTGTKYVAEMLLVLFETDVPPGRTWDPHAGSYKALWTRTLRQAEE